VFVGAIVSAILSAVHAALHAPASQLSHNIVVRTVPGLSEGGKLWSVRLTVLALSVVAFFIAITSEGIHELVETASAFGSAGVFVATLFALFTGFGGPASAYASIIAGMLVWAVGKYAFELPIPYLLGLLAALLGYVAMARFDAPRD
jgi:Na+/proline symporter